MTTDVTMSFKFFPDLCIMADRPRFVLCFVFDVFPLSLLYSHLLTNHHHLYTSYILTCEYLADSNRRKGTECLELKCRMQLVVLNTYEA